MSKQTGTLDLRVQGLAPAQVTKAEVDLPTVSTGDEILGTAGPTKAPFFCMGSPGGGEVARAYSNMFWAGMELGGEGQQRRQVPLTLSLGIKLGITHEDGCSIIELLESQHEISRSRKAEDAVCWWGLRRGRSGRM